MNFQRTVELSNPFPLSAQTHSRALAGGNLRLNFLINPSASSLTSILISPGVRKNQGRIFVRWEGVTVRANVRAAR
jgi:hypothetical protein